MVDAVRLRDRKWADRRWPSAMLVLPPEPPHRVSRVGIHLGDVLFGEPMASLMGDGVRIAARLEEHLRAGARSACPKMPIVKVKGRLDHLP